MLLPTAAFVAGVVVLQWCAGLPPLWAYAVVPLALCSLFWRSCPATRRFYSRFFLGRTVCRNALDPELAPALEGKTVLVEGRVLERPRQITPRQLRFLFYIERLDAGQGWSAFRGKARLSIYSADFKVAKVNAGNWRYA